VAVLGTAGVENENGVCGMDFFIFVGAIEAQLDKGSVMRKTIHNFFIPNLPIHGLASDLGYGRLVTEG